MTGRGDCLIFETSSNLRKSTKELSTKSSSIPKPLVARKKSFPQTAVFLMLFSVKWRQKRKKTSPLKLMYLMSSFIED